MKKFLSLIMATMLAIGTYTTAFAEELPQTIFRDGRVFTIDRSAGGGPNTATPDFDMRNTYRDASYKVLGSDVALYIDYTHGHGGDHFAAGWVQTTAPIFWAKAEVWANGRVDTTGSYNKNVGDIARASSYLAVGIVENAVPRIFYKW